MARDELASLHVLVRRYGAAHHARTRRCPRDASAGRAALAFARGPRRAPRRTAQRRQLDSAVASGLLGFSKAPGLKESKSAPAANGAGCAPHSMTRLRRVPPM